MEPATGPRRIAATLAALALCTALLAPVAAAPSGIAPDGEPATDRAVTASHAVRPIDRR